VQIRRSEKIFCIFSAYCKKLHDFRRKDRVFYATLGLSPPVLQQHGLRAALAWLAKEMQSGHGLSVTFRDSGQNIEPESVALASVLFRMVKELLFNVVKHAGVTSAHMDARINGNMIAISVQDQGKGFDAADLQVRQDVFGLFSIEERINVLGGAFTIDSSPGAGCRVTLSFPRKELSHVKAINAPPDQPVLNTVPGSPIASVGDQNVRIIIADDHSTMREGLVHLLKDKEGLEVIAQAGDGRQVIGLAKELNPDLILMDVSMPELDGIQATAHISRVQPDICIIGLIGGSAWESNPPGTVLAPHTGFEVREPHQ
jgi:hypothetical protein